MIGLHLCPFAKYEWDRNRIRFTVSPATNEEQLLMALQAELDLLTYNSTIATTLLIHPAVLQDFFDYNQFLDYADRLLTQMELDGIYQIASFHPDYQFAGTDPDDVENYTNKSPYPLLHLLREDSLEQAIARYPAVAQIPERNIEHLKQLGRPKMQALLHACFQATETD